MWLKRIDDCKEVLNVYGWHCLVRWPCLSACMGWSGCKCKYDSKEVLKVYGWPCLVGWPCVSVFMD